MQQELEKVTVDSATNTPDTDHFYCMFCYPDGDHGGECIGLCGEDLTNVAYGHREDSVKCVVCFDLVDLPCSKCGL